MCKLILLKKVLTPVIWTFVVILVIEYPDTLTGNNLEDTIEEYVPV